MLLGVVGVAGLLWLNPQWVGARPAAKPLVITMPANRPSQATLKATFPGDSQTVLEQADRLILYSVSSPLDVRVPEGREKFHGYPVIATEVKNPKIRKALVAHFYNSMAQQIQQASCFEPHHAIRAIKGPKVVDLLICFGCSGVKIWYGDLESGTNVSPVGQRFFNDVLDDAGVPNNWSGQR